ncbi:hypothetical protein TNCV_4998511 [Trichonephila clavipes]|nr:hypothetical protein TNCV_4998511 [Trichonephila clavipes]
MRSEGGSVYLPIGWAARLPLEERVAQRPKDLSLVISGLDWWWGFFNGGRSPRVTSLLGFAFFGARAPDFIALIRSSFTVVLSSNPGN